MDCARIERGEMTIISSANGSTSRAIASAVAVLAAPDRSSQRAALRWRLTGDFIAFRHTLGHRGPACAQVPVYLADPLECFRT